MHNFPYKEGAWERYQQARQARLTAEIPLAPTQAGVVPAPKPTDFQTARAAIREQVTRRSQSGLAGWLDAHQHLTGHHVRTVRHWLGSWGWRKAMDSPAPTLDDAVTLNHRAQLMDTAAAGRYAAIARIPEILDTTGLGNFYEGRGDHFNEQAMIAHKHTNRIIAKLADAALSAEPQG